MSWHDPHRQIEPLEREIAAVDAGLAALVEAGVLPHAEYDHARLLAHRTAVAEQFEIPWTAISHRMQRLLYAINAIRQPRVMVAVGIFCGNTFISNAGAAIGPGVCYRAERLVGPGDSARRGRPRPPQRRAVPRRRRTIPGPNPGPGRHRLAARLRRHDRPALPRCRRAARQRQVDLPRPAHRRPACPATRQPRAGPQFGKFRAHHDGLPRHRARSGPLPAKRQHDRGRSRAGGVAVSHVRLRSEE